MAGFLAHYASVNHQAGDVRLMGLTLERAADIMSEVETIRAKDTIDGGVLEVISDARKMLSGVTEMVRRRRDRPSLLEHQATVDEATAATARAEERATAAARERGATPDPGATEARAHQTTPRNPYINTPRMRRDDAPLGPEVYSATHDV